MSLPPFRDEKAGVMGDGPPQAFNTEASNKGLRSQSAKRVVKTIIGAAAVGWALIYLAHSAQQEGYMLSLGSLGWTNIKHTSVSIPPVFHKCTDTHPFDTECPP